MSEEVKEAKKQEGKKEGAKKSAPKKPKGEGKPANAPAETKNAKAGADEQKPKAEAPKAEGAAATTPAAEAVKKVRKKSRKNIPVGIVHIKSTFNNTIITFADNSGQTVSWASAGSSGFKGSRKSTPFAAQIAAEAAASRARDSGMRSVTISVKGPGAGRESAIRAIQKSGIRITAIRDVTPIPHNGCRPPKRRRV